MSTEQINRLHEKASERYLNGDYRGAIEAWRDVLGLDADNEQALEGVQLASQFVEPAPPPVPEVERDLDQGLKVLDGLGVSTLLQADLADGTVDRKPVASPAEDEVPGVELLPAWEAPPRPTPEAEAVGLDPVAGPSPAGSAPPSAAASELKRRVDELLAEAKTKAEAKERDEALAILSRLAILDEDNADAAALRAKIESEGASDLDKIEMAIIEGVAALEADNLDEAERQLNEALKLAPDHREARHYLDKVAERRASEGEDLLGISLGDAAPSEGAVERATEEPVPPPAVPEASKPIRPAASIPEPPVLPPAQARPRFTLPPTKFLVFGAIGAAALVSAAIALPRMLGGAAPKSQAPKLSAGSSAPSRPASPARPARPASPGPRSSTAATAAPAPAPATLSPDELARRLATNLVAARSLMASEDYGGAVVAFNEALSLDPANAEAKAGIADAGERYKAIKAERDAINNIKLAYRGGEFSSGLRLAYRLPPTVSASFVETAKVVGWYNLAVVALRAGDCKEALSHLGEALQVAPSDADSKQLREFASRYVEAVKDRVFLDHVEALAFRQLPPS
jgi:tetratricopeptide (TPR) repeat protein